MNERVMTDDYQTARPAHALPVYRAQDFYVAEGVGRGEPLGTADDLFPDDIYALNPDATQHRLTLCVTDAGFVIGPDSELGGVGMPVRLDSALVLMSPNGANVDVLVLQNAATGDVLFHPLTPLTPDTTYCVVSVNTDTANQVLAQVACVSFSRGTRIALASGAQVPIEDLHVGDRVLTRNQGPQEIRWIGQSTVRATGAFAPIMIKAGTLNNTGDLVVSPDHRLFVYQRSDALGTGHSDLLVKARHLVDGNNVRVRAGGFVDYFQLLFNDHQIIYAEGIAAESMLLDTRTKPALPPELLEQLREVMPEHSSGAAGFDVQQAVLDRPDVIEVLRRASMG